MKFWVITERYAYSGVPLAQLRLARALAKRGNEVDFFIGTVNSGYKLPCERLLKVINFEKERVIEMIMPLIYRFRSERPDVVLVAGDHLSAVTLLAALISGSNAKISCSSRVTPFDTYSNIPFTKRWILKYIMRIVMNRANALTCVSEDMVLQYGRIFKSAHYVPLYNVVFDQYSESLMNEDVNEEWFLDKSTPILIAAGALEVWKGFSDLLLAMRELVKIRKIRLIILGDGPQRQILQVFINNFNLDHAVKLLGYVDNPLKYFKRADIFVLSSYVDGLPNVLVEAMMCGCTPVATDCPTGPREVLQDGKYGYLVPVGNPIALMNGIEMAINYPISKEQLNEAINPFTETEVIKKHLNLLGISS